MTPLEAWLVASGFVTLLLVVTAIGEQTEVGRRFVARAIDWVLR